MKTTHWTLALVSAMILAGLGPRHSPAEPASAADGATVLDAELIGMLGTLGWGGPTFPIAVTTDHLVAVFDAHLFIADIRVSPARIVSKTPLRRPVPNRNPELTYVAQSLAFVHEIPGSFIRPFDISDPARPVELGTFALPGYPNAFTSDDRWAYFAASTWLAMVDLRDPARAITVKMSEADPLYFGVGGIAAGDGFLAWSGGGRKPGSEVFTSLLKIFSVSPSGELRLVLDLASDTNGWGAPSSIANHRLLMQAGGRNDPRIELWDLLALPSIRVVGTWSPGTDDYLSAGMDGDLVSLIETPADAQGGRTSRRLRSLRFTERGSFETLATFDLPIQGLRHSGRRVCSYPSELWPDPDITCYDSVTGPISKLSAYTLSAEGQAVDYHGTPPSLTVAGDLLFVGQEANGSGSVDDKYLAFDIRDPRQPKRVQPLETFGPPELRRDGAHLYALASSGKELGVYDVSQVDAPVLRGTWCAGSGACPAPDDAEPLRAIEARGDTLYALDRAGTLAVLDASDPERIRRAGELRLVDTGGDMALVRADSLIVLAYAGGSPLLVDVSIPGTPRLVRSLSEASGAGQLAVSQNTAIFAASNRLIFLDFASVQEPSPRGVVALDRAIKQLAATRSRAYAVEHSDLASNTQLWELDPHAPAGPQALGRFPLGSDGLFAAAETAFYFVSTRRRLVEIWTGLRPGDQVDLSHAIHLPFLLTRRARLF
jgi:hypothetical protein